MGEGTATDEAASAADTSAGQSDMVSDLVDRVLDTIDRVRVAGTENAVRAVRAVVFGMVGLIFAIASVIFFVVVLVRLADAYFPIGAGVGDATWAAHLFIGGLLAILGFGLWASRRNEGMARIWAALTIDVGIIVGVVVYAIVG
jgi:hypothetical protein